MERQIIKTIKYFTFFNYSPSFEEIFIYHPAITTKKKLKYALTRLISRKRLSLKDKRYTLGEYSNNYKWKEDRAFITRQKLQKAIRFLILASTFPQLKLIGLSGSAAMANAKKEDDIDLFIITAKNRLWTGRLIAVLIASFFGRRRFNDPHTSDKLCLNLFFDENNLKIARNKQTAYVAHEVLQMKPVFDKNNTYNRFIKENNWVFKYFPNAKDIRKLDKQFFDDSWNKRLAFTRLQEQEFAEVKQYKIGDWFEKLAKKAQMYLIESHQTTERITSTQLWFFPNDFEKKIRNI